MLELLLFEHGGLDVINVGEDSGTTALFASIHNKHTEITNVFLEAGADPRPQLLQNEDIDDGDDDDTIAMLPGMCM